MLSGLEKFGKYVLLEKLASGGMAEVYLAKSTGAEGIGRFFAIKRILPQYSDNNEFIDMFKEEAKLVMNLHHGNIVQIFEFGIEKSQFFLVMEFVEGQNLRQILNHMLKSSKKFSIDQILFVVKEVAAGLEHAHRSLDKSTGKPLNIIHRDMSPQNIMISFEGEVKIVDFGIAKAENQLEQTRAGTVKGKFSYMSPEQAEAQTVDLRTDVFSLGIILWELLTGERLFTSQNEAATLKKVRDCNIPSPRKLNSNVSAELEKIVLKSLAKDKSVRYQNSAAFHKDLNRYMNLAYPEFSPQDFSIFMKSIYAETFMENRKKLSHYAQLSPPQEDDKTAISFTESMAGQSQKEKSASSNFLADAPNTESNGRIEGIFDSGEGPQHNFKGVQIKEEIESSIRKKTIERKLGTKNKKEITQTNSSFMDLGARESKRSKRRKQNSAGSSLGLTLFTFVCIAFAGWYIFLSGQLNWQKQVQVWTQKLSVFVGQQAGQRKSVNTFVDSLVHRATGKETAAKRNTVLDSEQLDQASRIEKTAINVQSVPQGATVQIDGVVVGVTPYAGQIKANSQFQVVLTKEGYLPYTQPNEHAIAGRPHLLKPTLIPEPPSAYLKLVVLGGTSNLVLRVNDVKLNEKFPVEKLRIPSGVPVRVQVLDPFNGKAIEKTVTLGQGQFKILNFNLSKTAEQNN